MNTLAVLENPFLATKFYVPGAQGTTISRSCLTALPAESLRYPLTLISAPVGFGKTILLSAWAQSYPVNKSLVAWLSLDQEDNEPRLFWAYLLFTLNKQRPKHFISLLMQLQSPQGQSLKHILIGFINLLVENQALCWIEKLDLRKWHGTPFTCKPSSKHKNLVCLTRKAETFSCSYECNES